MTKANLSDGPSADFISDARRDERLPDAASWEELRSYLVVSRRACREAVDAAFSVWTTYANRRAA